MEIAYQGFLKFRLGLPRTQADYEAVSKKLMITNQFCINMEKDINMKRIDSTIGKEESKENTDQEI